MVISWVFLHMGYPQAPQGSMGIDKGHNSIVEVLTQSHWIRSSTAACMQTEALYPLKRFEPCLRPLTPDPTQPVVLNPYTPFAFKGSKQSRTTRLQSPQTTAEALHEHPQQHSKTTSTGLRAYPGLLRNLRQITIIRM